MDVAGDHAGHGAHDRPRIKPGRQQRWGGVGLVQPFEDRQALGQHRSVDLESRDQALGVERKVGLASLLALTQVMGLLIMREALEVEGDPHTVGRGRAPISVQDRAHRGRSALAKPSQQSS